MIPTHDNPAVLMHGDAIACLRTLPAESVHCCITSPPYWGLRDYGTGQWEGGSAECDHDQRRRERDQESKSATSAGASRDGLAGRDTCRKCGAVRIDRQLGLEPTPDAYVAGMVAVFREVWRVLHPSGTLWVNLGSSYASGSTVNKSGKREVIGDGGNVDGIVRVSDANMNEIFALRDDLTPAEISYVLTELAANCKEVR